jgi:mono/diheme cytochrome c family protein
MRRLVVVVFGVTTLLAAAALAQTPNNLTNKQLQAIGEGRGAYLTYCTSCHGTDARGGPTGTNHGTAPDLTLIAERDGGFNDIHVANHIRSGYVDSGAPMPRWGKVLAAHKSAGWADTRVLVLTRYLGFIQPAESELPVER